MAMAARPRGAHRRCSHRFAGRTAGHPRGPGGHRLEPGALERRHARHPAKTTCPAPDPSLSLAGTTANHPDTRLLKRPAWVHPSALRLIWSKGSRRARMGAGSTTGWRSRTRGRQRRRSKWNDSGSGGRKSLSAPTNAAKRRASKPLLGTDPGSVLDAVPVDRADHAVAGPQSPGYRRELPIGDADFDLAQLYLAKSLVVDVNLAVIDD